MLYELFAFDLDGTLLDQNGEFFPGVLGFVQDLQTMAKVTLATGRSLSSAFPYINILRITAPVILYHGAVIYDVSTKTVLKEAVLPGEVARQVLHLVQDSAVSVQIYRALSDPVVYISEMSSENQKFLAKERLRGEIVDLNEVIDQGVLKMLLIGKPEVLSAVAAVLKTKVKEANVVRSEEEYLEVLSPRASKGEALTWLCQKFGVPLERVVAVGDQESDLSMIKVAGLGVAMAHSPKGVKSEANLVVSSVCELVIRLKFVNTGSDSLRPGCSIF